MLAPNLASIWPGEKVRESSAKLFSFYLEQYFFTLHLFSFIFPAFWCSLPPPPENCWHLVGPCFGLRAYTKDSDMLLMLATVQTQALMQDELAIAQREAIKQ